MEAGRLLDAVLRSRRGLAALGGLALLVGLGTRALRGTAAPELSTPAISEDEARLCLRAMVAAATADGVIDPTERERLERAVRDAGLGEADAAWLAREIDDPASIEAIADPVEDPETAARVYAAARLAIEPDTMQERAFLKMLAEALDLDAEAISRIEAGA